MVCGINRSSPVNSGLAAPGRIFRGLGVAVLLAACWVLAGCGNSAADRAASQASQASRKASGLQASAGDYRPVSSFPIALSAPLSATALSAALDSANKHPSQYVAARSNLRDLKQADVLLGKELALPALPSPVKGVLAAQKAMVELAAVEHRLQKSVSLTSAAQVQVERLSETSQRVGEYQNQIHDLRSLRKTYAAAGVKELALARLAETQSASRVHTAAQKVAALHAQLANDSSRQQDYYNHGVKLQNAARLCGGEKSLDLYKQAMTAMNQAAAVGQQVQIVQAQWELARQAWATQQRSYQESQAQVRQLTSLRQTSTAIAHHEAQQISALRSSIKQLVAGPLTVASATMQKRLQRVYSSLHRGAREAKKALALCSQARQDLQTAAMAVGQNATLAQQLTAHGAAANDPLVMAYTSHNPLSLLHLYHAYAAVRAAQVGQMLMWNLRLQQDATALAQQAFTAAHLTPPAAPPSENMDSLRQDALAALQKADSDLKQAQGLLGSGHSPAHWLTPAMGYQMAETQATLATDSTTRDTALQQAAQYAATANQLNPFLKLGSSTPTANPTPPAAPANGE